MVAYDALLLVGFGGPEGPDDVLPFLQNVTHGKRVPQARLAEVAEHYARFGGVSPINAQNRALLAAIRQELLDHGPRLPVYWGNRNWHPMLADTVRQMADDGIRHALAFVTSAFRSYPGCRQYLEDLARACQSVGPQAPQIDKLRAFYNHPGFIEPQAERLQETLAGLPADRRDTARLIFTAHSIPTALAQTCRYEADLREACRLVAERVGRSQWELVYQSRSGPPSQPWLGPDVCDRLAELGAGGSAPDVVLVPVGFLSEHLEVIYDLDVEAKAVCDRVGVRMTRCSVVGTHPRLVRMVRELVEERMSRTPARLALGDEGPGPDMCAADCCPGLARPAQ